MTLLLLLLYAAMAVLTYGLSLAYWEREFPLEAKESHTDNITMSLVIALIWSVGLPLFGLICRPHHGLKFY